MSLQNQAKNCAKRYLKQLDDVVDKINKHKSVPDKWKYTFIGDLQDHILVCQLIIDDKFIKAFDLMCGLDTQSRDNIPLYIWTTMDHFG